MLAVSRSRASVRSSVLVGGAFGGGGAGGVFGARFGNGGGTDLRSGSLGIGPTPDTSLAALGAGADASPVARTWISPSDAASAGTAGGAGNGATMSPTGSTLGTSRRGSALALSVSRSAAMASRPRGLVGVTSDGGGA